MNSPVPPPDPALPAALVPLERSIAERAARGDLSIPPYPAVAIKVQEAMSRRQSGLAEVAQLVGADAALAADILRCANSAMYRRGAPVADLTQAITRIGAQQVLRLLLASGLAEPVHAVGPLVALRRRIWIEGLAAAAVCQELAVQRGLRGEEAFVVGLLHDFGQIVVTATLEALFERDKLAGAFTLGAWRALVERQHVPVGVVTAARWNLPPVVAEVMAGHHLGRGARCREPEMLELVRAADGAVALLFERDRVSAEDLAAVPGIAPPERAPLERVLEGVPEFVAAFETPSAAAAIASPRVQAPATTFAAPGVPVRFGVSISVARRPRLYRATAASAEGLVLEGDEPLPENRLLEAKIYAERPFTTWVLSRLSSRAGAGWRVEIQPFALTGEARELWSALLPT